LYFLPGGPLPSDALGNLRDAGFFGFVMAQVEKGVRFPGGRE
jgi:hypothetical protein